MDLQENRARPQNRKVVRRLKDFHPQNLPQKIKGSTDIPHQQVQTNTMEALTEIGGVNCVQIHIRGRLSPISAPEHPYPQ